MRTKIHRLDQPSLLVLPRGVFTVLVCTFTMVGAYGAEKDLARKILDETGIRGGLIVHLGCGDGTLTAALRANDRYLVHGLHADPANVARARTHIRSLGLYGPVSTDAFEGSRLPYVNNLVNLLVAEELDSVTMDEVMRVLAPLGVAYIGGKKTVKPWPSDKDEWTHWLHSPDNNAVSRDELVTIPRALQWIDGPLWLKSHEANPALSAMVTARGRLFYIVDESASGISHMPDRWFLIARDAFNGVQLWRRPIKDWGVRQWRLKSTGDWSGGRFSNPHQVLRRLVAVGDKVFVTLGVHAPVSQLDAATGKILQSYEGTEKTFEIVCFDGTLYLAVNKSLGDQQADVAVSIVAVDAATGKVLWERSGYKGLRPVLTLSQQYVDTTLTVGKDGVFFVDYSEIVALDRKTGKPLWTVPRPERSVPPNIEKKKSYYISDLCTLVYHQGLVFFSQVYDRKNNHPKIGQKPTVLFAVDAASGKKLWSIDTRSIIHYTSPDIFVNDGLVWFIDQRATAFMGVDRKTGTKKKTIDASLIWKGYHHNCYRNKATRDFILYGRNKGVEFFNVDTDSSKRVNWIKGACRYGILPANGMLYMPSHNCACHATAKLNGIVALNRTLPRDLKPSTADAVTRGQGFDKPLKETGASANDWPTYRKDTQRSAFQAAAPRGSLTVKWSVKAGKAPTPPVIADGKVFVAARDAHSVHCLNEEDGKLLWSYRANGFINSAPTYCKGRLIFGGRDGVVYALNAGSGELIWSFRAAPAEMQIVAFDHLESIWPSHGTLLVQDDTVYCSAGRSTYLDSGLFLYALDIKTGRPLHSRRLQPDLKGDGEMQGGLNSDLLVSDGKNLNMRGMVFSKELEVVSGGIGANRIPNETPTTHGTFLTAMGGFLDDSYFNVAMWKFGKHSGNMLAMAGNQVVGIWVYPSLKIKSSGHENFEPGEQNGYLFETGSAPVANNARKKEKGAGGRYKWKIPLPIRGTAMVVGNDHVFLAGVEDKVGTDDAWKFYDGKMGAKLLVYSRADGTLEQELKLASVPVFDGMASANGKLFISCTDGSLACLVQKR